MLDGAADADSQVKFGRNRLAGAADLAVHGQPAGIAYGTRRGNLSAQRVRERLGQLDVLLFFDAAAHGDNNLGLGKIDGLLGFLERIFGLVADHTVGDLRVHRLDWGGGRAGLSVVGPQSARLKTEAGGW